MPRKSKGERKQISGRVPVEVYEAFEAKLAKLELAQNDALIAALSLWAASGPKTNESTLQPPFIRSGAVVFPEPTSVRHVAVSVPLAGTFERKPYQKGAKK